MKSKEKEFSNASSFRPYSCLSWNATSIFLWCRRNWIKWCWCSHTSQKRHISSWWRHFEQYYIHRHQIDHNLVIEGSRKFTLINPKWDEPHHVIFLNRAMGAMKIPIGTYHRSESGKEGSIVSIKQPEMTRLIKQKSSHLLACDQTNN